MAHLTFDSFSNIIDGQLVATTSVRCGIDPANNKELWPTPVSTADHVQAAVDAAKRGALVWAATPITERQQRVLQFADELANNTESLAKILTREQGKPLAAARAEISDAVRMLKGAAKLQLPETVVEDNERRRVVTRHVPLGVCVGIVPWNFPLVLSSFKIGPALVAGNAFILKPSPFTPYCGLKLVELAQKFFPPGVMQALSGDDGLGPWLTAHPGVDKVSFTGSTMTGIKVMQSCAQTLKRVTLELGGNDPAIICPDVDIKAVAPKVAALALYNSGQVCIAIKRVYVHSSIYDDFVAAMVDAIKSMTVGDGMSDGTVLGPVQNRMQYQKLIDMTESIKAERFNVLTGDLAGTFTEAAGLFVQPVVVDNPPDASRIVVDEPFGPIFPVMKWEDEGEVIRRANTCADGLGASVWTRDLRRADRIARQIQAGNVWINTHMELQPDAAFGGHKQSGIGCELGLEGLKTYCNVQTIYQNKGN